MDSLLKTALCVCTLLSTTFIPGACFAQTANWRYSSENYSPHRWANSPQNWRNSPDNWQNSPQNWQNSPDNYNSTNGVYEDGNRIGYAVPRADGSGVNFFNNNGHSTGYQLFEDHGRRNNDRTELQRANKIKYFQPPVLSIISVNNSRQRPKPPKLLCS
jgi:hypothetical protein